MWKHTVKVPKLVQFWYEKVYLLAPHSLDFLTRGDWPGWLAEGAYFYAKIVRVREIDSNKNTVWTWSIPVTFEFIDIVEEGSSATFEHIRDNGSALYGA